MFLPDGKFNLREIYGGFGIYQEITPSGYPVSQHYAFTNGDITVESESYMHNNIEDIMFIIDTYIESGKLGVKVITEYSAEES